MNGAATEQAADRRAFVEDAREPGTYGDGRGGHGLYLRVRKTANGRLARYFAQRVRIAGTVTNLGIGSYPVITLKEARQAALANRRAIARGQDPKSEGIPAFRTASEKVILLHNAHWRSAATEKQWQQHMEVYVFPFFGDKKVNRVTGADVLRCLLPIWSTKRATAALVRQRIRTVLEWCVAYGFCEFNACDAVSGALPKAGRSVTHHKAVPHPEVRTALVNSRRDGPSTASLCFEFMVLTASRPTEACRARWSEVDLENRIWTVPAVRMKRNREHRVPLSSKALAVPARSPRTDRRGRAHLSFPHSSRANANIAVATVPPVRDRGDTTWIPKLFLRLVWRYGPVA